LIDAAKHVRDQMVDRGDIKVYFFVYSGVMDLMGIHLVLILLGGLFVVGLAADVIGRRTRLPRVTLLILFGVLAGPVGFDVLPAQVSGWYEFLASTA
jgi:Kef-type K+ transport system membrane component KefB